MLKRINDFLQDSEGAADQIGTVTESAISATEESHPWYALRVRSNHQRVAAVHLRYRRIEEFNPTYRVEKRWSDRNKQVEQFLFPGYVFCRLNVSDRLPVLSVPGAMRLVGFGTGPTPIPDQEIEGVRQMLASGLLVAPWPFLKTGQHVTVERGPLEGVEGILQQVNKKTFRLVVSIQILQRSVSVELDRDWVRPIADRKTALAGEFGWVQPPSGL